jgi:hypothetical protein
VLAGIAVARISCYKGNTKGTHIFIVDPAKLLSCRSSRRWEGCEGERVFWGSRPFLLRPAAWLRDMQQPAWPSPGAASIQVSPPSAFPVPLISTAQVERRVILLSNGLQIEATVLGPGPNRVMPCSFYEITRTIRNSIFGQVHHAVVITPHESNPMAFQRVEPFQQVAISYQGV